MDASSVRHSFGSTGDVFPKVHRQLGRQGHKICRYVDHLLGFENTIETLLLDHALDKGIVVVDLKVSKKLVLTVINDVLWGDDTLVVAYEISECYGSLEANEGCRNVIKGCCRLNLAQTCECLVQTLPRTSRRVDLVWLIFIGVLKVLVIVVDEIPDHL